MRPGFTDKSRSHTRTLRSTALPVVPPKSALVPPTPVRPGRRVETRDSKGSSTALSTRSGAPNIGGVNSDAP